MLQKSTDILPLLINNTKGFIFEIEENILYKHSLTQFYKSSETFLINMLPILDYISSPDLKEFQSWGKLTYQYFDSHILDFDFSLHLDINSIEIFLQDQLNSNFIQQLYLDSINFGKEEQKQLEDLIQIDQIDLFKSENDPEIHQTFEQIVEEQGLQFENHSVTTDDGYILNLFRIRLPSTRTGTPVVFLQHGIMASADTFIVHKNQSIGVQIAKAGYDVWLGNNRGNIYSRNHLKYNPNRDQEKYFDYSFQELGQYDLPAQIDFVTNFTNVKQISYIGHSQGTSQMFSALSQGHGKISDKINVFVALAPVVNLQHTTNSLLKAVTQIWKVLIPSEYLLGLYEINDPQSDYATRTFCSEFGIVCDAITSFLDKEGSPYNDPKLAKIVNLRPGSSTSTKALLHFGEIINTGIYRQYDYGTESENLAHYGSKIVPSIDLKNFPEQVKVALISGKQDDLADEQDVEWLYDQIKNNIIYKQFIDQFDHHSFSIGKKTEWIQDVIQILKKYNSPNI